MLLLLLTTTTTTSSTITTTTSTTTTTSITIISTSTTTTITAILLLLLLQTSFTIYKLYVLHLWQISQYVELTHRRNHEYRMTHHPVRAHMMILSEVMLLIGSAVYYCRC